MWLSGKCTCSLSPPAPLVNRLTPGPLSHHRPMKGAFHMVEVVSQNHSCRFYKRFLLLLFNPVAFWFYVLKAGDGLQWLNPKSRARSPAAVSEGEFSVCVSHPHTHTYIMLHDRYRPPLHPCFIPLHTCPLRQHHLLPQQFLLQQARWWLQTFLTLGCEKAKCLWSGSNWASFPPPSKITAAVPL